MSFRPESKKLFFQIIADLFILSFVFYLILLWIDRAYKDYVRIYFDSNIILGIVIVTGAITVLARARKRKPQ